MIKHLERTEPYHKESDVPCTRCVFLGVIEETEPKTPGEGVADLWYCSNEPTMIAIFGREGNYKSGTPHLERKDDPLTIAYHLAEKKNIIISDMLWLQSVLLKENVPAKTAWIIEQAEQGMHDFMEYSFANTKEFVNRGKINIFADGTRSITEREDKKAVVSVSVKLADSVTSIAHRMVQKIEEKSIQSKIPFDKTVQKNIQYP